MSFKIAQKYAVRIVKLPQHTPGTKLPDAPVCGNGDIGVAAAADLQEGLINFYIGKNDIWNSRSVWEEPGARPFGICTLKFSQRAFKSYEAVQNISNAKLKITLKKEDAEVTVTCCALRGTSCVVFEASSKKGNAEITANLTPIINENEATAKTVNTNSECICEIAYGGEGFDWPLNACGVLKKANANKKGGRHSTYVLSVNTSFDSRSCTEKSVRDCESMLISRTPFLSSHSLWWRSFWNKSTVELAGLPAIEKAWYTSQYISACCTGKESFPPGLFGNFVTTASPAWGGDYHLNYNYEAAFWGLYSSNRIELSGCYDAPLLGYMEKAEKAAREKLNCSGLYMLVGIGPKGLRTAALTDKNGCDDVNYWGQKSNAAYACANMIMRFYSTLDKEYTLKTAFPFMKKTADFWLDYLVLENGKYNVVNDCIYENQASAIGVFDWADENTIDGGTDKNPLITLGLLKMLFKALCDINDEFELSHPLRLKWQDVLCNLSGFPTMRRNGETVFRYTESGTEWGDNNSLGIQHIYPAGCIGLSSEKGLLETAKNTLRQLNRWEDYNAFPTFFPAAVRVGESPKLILQKLSEQLKAHTLPNGFIFFGGGGVECQSTVLVTVNEMLMQSHEGFINLFPVWNLDNDASFISLRAYGAFLVSAAVINKKITNVKIRSEKGKPCKVKIPYKANVAVYCKRRLIAEKRGSDEIEFTTKQNKTYCLKID